MYFLSFLGLFISGALIIQTAGFPTIPYGFGTARQVLIIGVDGLGAVHLDNATHMLPNFALFYENGSVASTGVARAELITVSAINWAAAITGMSPSQSGIVDKKWLPPNTEETDQVKRKCSLCNSTEEIHEAEYLDGIGTVPSVTIKECTTLLYEPPDPPELHRLSSIPKIPEAMWVSARKQDSSLKVAVVHSWQWIRHFVTSQTVDWSHNCQGNDFDCVEKFVEILKQETPQLSFLHLDSVDFAGHKHGFGGPQYYTALKIVDGYIGELLKALDESNMLNTTLIMVTSDHGGYRTYHGHFNEENIFIPALFLGPGVRRGAKLNQFIGIMDFAPTALNALGLQPGVHMRGHIVKEIYKGDP